MKAGNMPFEDSSFDLFSARFLHHGEIRSEGTGMNIRAVKLRDIVMGRLEECEYGTLKRSLLRIALIVPLHPLRRSRIPA